jgi:hypothetical protein
MVCGRCEMAVKNELDKLKISFSEMQWRVTLDRNLEPTEKIKLSDNLKT